MALLILLMGASVGKVSAATLSPAEEQALMLIREEEKLARDVYLQLYDQFKLRIFNNIAKSEQTHMDAAKTLLDRYGIQDPATQEIGVFTNGDVQALYNSLMESATDSLVEALETGIEIEKEDIKDLQDSLNITKQRDIKKVFTNLLRASNNHLESFEQVLEVVSP